MTCTQRPRATGLTDFGGDDYLEPLRVLLDSYAREANLTPAGSKMSRFFLKGRTHRPAAQRGRVAGEPAVRRRADRASDLRDRPAPHRHHRAAPAAHRRPRPSGTGDGSPSGRNPVHRTTRGPTTRCSPSSRRRSPSITSTIPSSWDCTTWPPTRWRNAGSSCGRASCRCPTNAWPISRRTRGGWPARIGHPPTPGIAETCSSSDPTTPNAGGCSEPEPPVRPRRTARGVPRCTGDSDAPCAGNHHRLGVQSRRTRHPRLVGHVHRRHLGRSQLELWSRGLRVFTESRARHNPEQFLDVDFADLRRDPMGTVERVYAALGIPMSEAARSGVRTLDEESKTGARAPSHTPTRSPTTDSTPTTSPGPSPPDRNHIR